MTRQGIGAIAATAVLTLGTACARATTTAAIPDAQSSVEPSTRADVPVNADAAVLHDFNRRIAEYVTLHKRAMKQAPRVKESANPDTVNAAKESVVTIIRAARAHARQGDIFTPSAARAGTQRKGRTRNESRSKGRRASAGGYPVQSRRDLPDDRDAAHDAAECAQKSAAAAAATGVPHRRQTSDSS